MGIFQDFINKRIVEPVADRLAKSQSPDVTEVPTNMQVGYAYTGGARRKQSSVVDFDTLRTFSVMYDVARACINHRKRQIANLEWAIVPKDEEKDSDSFKNQIDEITEFFNEPVNGNDFRMFVDKIIEDLLVVDAAVLWKDRTFGGDLVSLLPVDGTTIRIKVAEDGTLPEPPDFAYQQVIYGKVQGEYTTDEMIYKIFNPRNNSPYGLSPLECLIIAVDSSLRSQLYNASMLSEGTVPEGFFGMPPEWTPDQIKDFQIWFDTMMAGNATYNTRIKFMPGGKGVGYIPTKKPEDMRFLELERWMLMKTCAMFDVQPEDIGFIDNVTASTGQSQQELGNERGLVPMANFLKEMFTKIVQKDFKQPDLKFEWKGLQVVDNEFELERSKVMMEHGSMTINELRVAQGFEPLKEEVADKAMIYTPGGPILLEVVANEAEAAVVPKEVVPEGGNGAPQDQNQEQDGKDDTVEEMDKWERKAIKSLKDGKGADPVFKSEHIDKAEQVLIHSRLSVAKSKEEIKAAFAPFKEHALEQSLITKALKVTGEIADFKRKKYDTAGSRT